MTFVLNLLHKDYSLLAADRRGSAMGPITLSTGSARITTRGKSILEGVKKVQLTSDSRHALGFAGETSAHGYLAAFKDASSMATAMQCIRAHMESYFRFEERDRILRAERVMENQLIVSGYDTEKGAFFSSLHVFTLFSNASQLYARRQNPDPMLLHVGSGSNHFEKAVGLEEINNFIARLREGIGIDERLAWIDDAFRKVSAADPGCGETYDAVVATRDKPEFVRLRGGDSFSIRPVS